MKKVGATYKPAPKPTAPKPAAEKARVTARPVSSAGDGKVSRSVIELVVRESLSGKTTVRQTLSDFPFMDRRCVPASRAHC